MMQRILFLPRWYPNRYDAMPGLFIQKLAESVSRHCVVTVLYVHPDECAADKYELVSSIENGVNVVRVYYQPPGCRVPLFGSFLKALRFLKAEYIGLCSLEISSFNLVHVHVLTRQGLVAFLIRICKGIPYIITEHWSRYFKENNTYKGPARKLLTRIVVRHASGVIAVSEKLKTAMMRHGLNNPAFKVIPNSVDTMKFRIIPENRHILSVIQRNDPLVKPLTLVPGQAQGNLQGEIVILHVSCFEDKSKNISGFLRVVHRIYKERQNFRVIMVGDGPELKHWKEYARDLGLEDHTVTFPGLKTHEELCSLFNACDFLVLSSHYETFGTVIIEAMACGLPVVSADVGVASAVINDETGLLAAAGDEKSLQGAIVKMLGICRSFDRMRIRNNILGFDENTVTGKLLEVYNEVICS